MKNYEVRHKEDCIKELMKGNIEEAKLYVKKRRDEFLKEVDNSKEYQ